MKPTVSWGAKKNTTYSVKAATLQDALDALGKDEWGKFEGTIDYTWDDKNGVVTSVTLKPSYSILMPVWSDYSSQPKTCKDEWDRMIKALKKHEEGHLKIFNDNFNDLVKKLTAAKSLKGSEVDKMLADTLATIQKEHDSYDAKNNHGAKEGVELNIAEECMAEE